MLQIVALIAPIFGLIGLGFASAKVRALEGNAAQTLSLFGYRVAMPALLFRAMANMGSMPVSPIWLALAFVSAVAVTWTAATLATHFLLRRPREDAPAFAMGACFSNGVMLGFPVILLFLGPEAATPLAFLATCDVVLLWLAGTFHMGLVARDSGRAGARAIGAVLADVARNPLIMALAAGLLWHQSGFQLPGPAARFIDLLAGAAIPVSLFALGMSLAAYNYKGQTASVAVLCVLKLLVFPALAFLFATQVFELPRIWIGTLVIYVAMPVGANAFIFAARYNRAVGSISAAVAISTVLAVATVTIAVTLLTRAGIVIPQ